MNYSENIRSASVYLIVAKLHNLLHSYNIFNFVHCSWKHTSLQLNLHIIYGPPALSLGRKKSRRCFGVESSRQREFRRYFVTFSRWKKCFRGEEGAVAEMAAREEILADFQVCQMARVFCSIWLCIRSDCQQLNITMNVNLHLEMFLPHWYTGCPHKNVIN